MNNLKLKAFRNAFFLTAEQAGEILGVTTRQIQRLEKGDQGITPKIEKKIEGLLEKRKKVITQRWALIEESTAKGVAKVVLIYYPTLDGCESLLDKAFNNSTVMEISLLCPQVVVVNFNAKAYAAWLTANGKEDNQESRSQWAATQL